MAPIMGPGFARCQSEKDAGLSVRALAVFSRRAKAPKAWCRFLQRCISEPGG
ncbi:hypothetical protein [Pseudomonas chlororaphis]|uniref:hypothetical protein n=1 Tax=Pseudomonas chlororaphis TaxID=587753 RepID=UPI0012FD59AD|nr:hypothetical protein [Pseudomonas chlororaphis]